MELNQSSVWAQRLPVYTSHGQLLRFEMSTEGSCFKVYFPAGGTVLEPLGREPKLEGRWSKSSKVSLTLLCTLALLVCSDEDSRIASARTNGSTILSHLGCPRPFATLSPNQSSHFEVISVWHCDHSHVTDTLDLKGLVWRLSGLSAVF